MKVYNKLVRDKIPAIINADNGCKAVTRVLDNDEYLDKLNSKILEEVKEYLESGSVEELADLEEVLRGILDAKGVSYEEFESIRQDKVEKRGAFKDKIFLERVVEPGDK
ncbi:MAG: phosphoribosyl-ATP pyrophosphohydrolase [Clostridiales bacterium]|nr:phosphoribosyl-ATP pyrophosphohydrolase [Clostridiales bacterium]